MEWKKSRATQTQEGPTWPGSASSPANVVGPAKPCGVGLQDFCPSP